MGEKRIACDPAFGAESWQGAIAALKNVELPRKCRVTVVLSNHLVRYAVVPWSNALGTPAEEEAYVRHYFAKIHGERAKGWEVRVSDGLACAIDAALLAELRKIVPKLVSVQPALMAAYNGARKRIPREGAWLVLAEAQRVCVARLAAERWASVLNAREADWEQALERERSRASGETLPSRVLVLS